MSQLLANAIASLIEESPSVKAAMKAGKKTSIRLRVYREKTGKWDDYGAVARNGSMGWSEWLKGKFGVAKLVYRVGGHPVDEVDL